MALNSAISCEKRARTAKLEWHALSMSLMLQAVDPAINRQWGLTLQRALNSPWSELQLWS